MCKTDDGNHGPAAALPLALGLLAAVRRHVSDVKGAGRQSLLSLGAESAEFVGWLYRDPVDGYTGGPVQARVALRSE
ncbi:hypothetical protein AB0M45_30145 [Nocardia sp. NPDC051787]|uniref:hypothetical protein n=1 Tax=Nocardia sp. NPDC051787 TaxID=3155415 RepID=UPI0034306D6E